MPGIAEQSPDNWVHYYPYILKVGRTAHQAPLGTPEDDVEAAIAEMEEKDPNVDKLKAIAEDAKWGVTEENEGYLPWTFTVVGDTQKYTTEGGETTYSAVVIKSLQWPGALTVVKG